MRKIKRVVSVTLGLGLGLSLLWFFNMGMISLAYAQSPVTTFDDPEPDGCKPGDCSLREAIIAGVGNITLDQGTYTISRENNPNDPYFSNDVISGDLDIDFSLMITGAGPDKTIIDGGGIDRIFEIRVTLKPDSQGNPHLVTPTVVISGVTLRNGFLKPPLDNGAGGAIANRGGRLTIINSKITNNSITVDGGSGGGIFSSCRGKLIIQNSEISHNILFGQTVSDIGGGIAIGTGWPYLADCYDLFAQPLESFTLISSTVVTNTASEGGGLYLTLGELKALDSTISSNHGGGIVGQKAVISNSIVANNIGTAIGIGEGSLIKVSANNNTGWGILLDSGLVKDSIIENNTDGGINNSTPNRSGNITIENSRISSNTGRGIDMESGLVKDSIIENNTGGGISSYGNATIENSRITTNTVEGEGLAAPGGGITFGGVITITDSVIMSNTGHSYGGGLEGSGTATLQNTVIMSNTAQRGGGINIVSGTYVTSTLTIKDSIIVANTATGDDAGVYEVGGGLYFGGVNLHIEDSLFSHNTALKGDGGGIYLYKSDSVINNSAISHNTAGNGGGGIYNIRGNMHLNDTTVDSNTALNDAGGGIRNQFPAQLVLNRSTVSSNTTPSSGGGILNQGGTLNIINSTVSRNSSGSPGGGGIRNSTSGVITLTNTTVSSNTTTSEDGGGISNTSTSTTTLKNTIVAYNVATHKLNNCGGTGVLTINSSRHNLTDDDSCNLTNADDFTNTRAFLKLLSDNGGKTKTHALSCLSNAINGADNTASPDTDQRGVIRPQVLFSDIGAYELEAKEQVVETISAEISPSNGGSISTSSGGLSISFPARSVNFSTTVTIKTMTFPTAPPKPGLQRIDCNIYSISAVDSRNLQPVTTFNEKYKLTIRYDDTDVQNVGGNENSLNVYTSSNNGPWEPVLPCDGCSHNKTTNQFIIFLNHLTDFAFLSETTGNGDGSQNSVYLPVIVK